MKPRTYSEIRNHLFNIGIYTHVSNVRIYTIHCKLYSHRKIQLRRNNWLYHLDFNSFDAFCSAKGGSRHVSFARSDHHIRIVDAYHDRICGRVMIRVSWYAISIRRYDTARPMSCRFLSDYQRYNDDTSPWLWLLWIYGYGAIRRRPQLDAGLEIRIRWSDRANDTCLDPP
jgi:hypothetical protein